MNPLNIRVWKGDGGFDYPHEHSSWSSFWDFNNPEYEPDYIFEHSTGIKDANGLEIFEGDILELSNGQRKDIYFASGAFCIRGYDILWYGVKNNRYENGKVIGNIHQHSDLLIS